MHFSLPLLAAGIPFASAGNSLAETLQRVLASSSSSLPDNVYKLSGSSGRILTTPTVPSEFDVRSDGHPAAAPRAETPGFFGTACKRTIAKGDPGNRMGKEAIEVDGKWGQKWKRTAGENGYIYLVEDCVMNEEICEDMDYDACDTLYNGEGKQLMVLAGWNGKTTLQSVWEQIEDRDEVSEAEVTENEAGDTILEGYNLNNYRIGDVCPVSAGMCDDTVTVTFAVETDENPEDISEQLRRGACMALESGFWVNSPAPNLVTTLTKWASPDMLNCKYINAGERERRLQAGERRQEGTVDASITGSLQSMNLLLDSLDDDESPASELNEAGVSPILNPNATRTTDKEKNDGGMDIMTLLIGIIAIIFSCCCCCCFCCCRYVCKCCCAPKKSKDIV